MVRKITNGYERIRFMVDIIDEMQSVMDTTGAQLEKYIVDGKQRKFKNKADEARYNELEVTFYSALRMHEHYEDILKKL